MFISHSLKLFFDGYRNPRWYTQIWLLFKSKEYRKRREFVLRTIASKRGNRRFIKELMRSDYLLRKIEKDNIWIGGNMIVPFKSND